MLSRNRNVTVKHHYEALVRHLRFIVGKEKARHFSETKCV